MRRSIRVLVLGGTPVLAFGLLFFGFNADALCVDSCPPESDLAATIAARIADGAPIAVIAAVLVALAWILCLVQVARAGQRQALAALALALPLVAALSLTALYIATSGHLLPSTWAARDSGWDGAFLRALMLLLLWPVATFVATFALRQR